MFPPDHPAFNLLSIERTCRAHLAAALLAFSMVAPLHGQITEKPETVPPGKFLLEVDVLSLTFDDDYEGQDGFKYSAVGVGSAILQTGLTQNVDVQVGFDLFLRERFNSSDSRDSSSGIGNTYLRLKWSFWRDEYQAAAIIPYIKVPTASGGVGNDSIEGGFILPWRQSLAGGFDFGAMFAWDLARNDADDGYDSGWRIAAVVHRPLTSAIGAYAETTATVSSGGASKWAGTIGGGVTVKLTQGLQVDYSVSTGFTGGAYDWRPVVRLDWRF